MYRERCSADRVVTKARATRLSLITLLSPRSFEVVPKLESLGDCEAARIFTQTNIPEHPGLLRHCRRSSVARRSRWCF